MLSAATSTPKQWTASLPAPCLCAGNACGTQPSIHAGSLGHGWYHSYELALVVEELEGYAALHAADSRGG
jgi:hypothetical protein